MSFFFGTPCIYIYIYIYILLDKYLRHFTTELCHRPQLHGST